MTTIKVTTVFGRWDEAAYALSRSGLTLTTQNTVMMRHDEKASVLKNTFMDLWYLAAAGVIAGFSVDAQDIKANSEEGNER